jgi:DNA mismatch repair protein MutS
LDQKNLTSGDVAADIDLAQYRPTPMMEQYIEIKAANPDSLLFYRMGDFYELFFDDSLIASRALGIALTKRGKHLGQDIPMCGVPVHSADNYLQKLIGLGYRIAVCEQLEDPAEAKKRGSKSVVKRDVIRLVTPGTITEENLLNPGEANYLMTLARVKGSGEALALAWIDISTGTFRVAQTELSRLVSDVMRIDPRELIVSDYVMQDLEFKSVFDGLKHIIRSEPSSLFESTTAESRMTRFFGVKTLDGFGNFSRAELAAASAAIAYVEKTQIANRPPLQRPECELSSSTLFIDPATRTNLELTKTLSGERQGSLLRAIDRTVTGAGARLLAERLMSPLIHPQLIDHRLDSIAFLMTQNHICEALRLILRGAPDMPRALSRLALDRGGPRDLDIILRGIMVSCELINVLQSVDTPFELIQASQDLKKIPADLRTLLESQLGDSLPLLKRDGGFIRKGFHAQLDELQQLRENSRLVIAKMEGEFQVETGVRSLKIRHNNILGYYIEVTAQNADALNGTVEAKARFIHRQTMANAMRFTTVELAELEEKIANAAGQCLDIELSLFEALRQSVVLNADLIQTCAKALAVFDVCQGLTTLASEEALCRPIVDDSSCFSIIQGRHLVVEQALRREAHYPFMPNNCDLSAQNGLDSGKILLLTGPNMGGKSTFLRQNALIAILAQIGSFVPAASAHIGIVDRLFSRVGASDDLARGRSTFMVEMVETAAILNQAGSRSLVILDEIGRGTSTYDGLSIAWACVEHLHEVNQCRAIFATHFHELTVLSEKLNRLHNVTMRVKEHKGEVIFLHEIGHGSADRSYGVQVARLAGLPDVVIERAKAVLNQLESGDNSHKTQRLIDDLPLFQQGTKPEPNSSLNAVVSELKEINPDDLTPKQALEALYRLKKLNAGS